MRARRIAVARAAGRRRLRRIVWFLGLATVVGVGFGLTRTALLDVDRVRVTGIDRVPLRTVLEVSGVSIGEPMTDVSLGEAAEAIESLSWVREASVERSWPGTISIDVSERVPVAVVTDGDTHALVDADGAVMGVVESAPESLVRIEMDTTARVGSLLPVELRPGLTVAQRLTPELRSQVDSVRAADGGQVELGLSSGTRVRLGTVGEMTAKLVSLQTILDHLDQPVGLIDVRVPATPMVSGGVNAVDEPSA